jgi:hypothetical protein
VLTIPHDLSRAKIFNNPLLIVIKKNFVKILPELLEMLHQGRIRRRAIRFFEDPHSSPPRGSDEPPGE